MVLSSGNGSISRSPTNRRTDSASYSNLDKMTITGTPGECKEKIAAYRAAGIDLPLIK